jgi:hypothetical protein
MESRSAIDFLVIRFNSLQDVVLGNEILETIRHLKHNVR